MTMETQSQVGKAFGAVMRAYGDMMNDPMNDYTGYTPDPMPGLIRVARGEGWELDDLLAEVIRRTSGYWAYIHSCGLTSGIDA